MLKLATCLEAGASMLILDHVDAAVYTTSTRDCGVQLTIVIRGETALGYCQFDLIFFDCCFYITYRAKY